MFCGKERENGGVVVIEGEFEGLRSEDGVGFGFCFDVVS